MTTYEKQAISTQLREAIVQLCKAHELYTGPVEVDGLICITGQVEGQQHVIKIHENFTSNQGASTPTSYRKFYDDGSTAAAAAAGQQALYSWYSLALQAAAADTSLSSSRKRRRVDEMSGSLAGLGAEQSYARALAAAAAVYPSAYFNSGFLGAHNLSTKHFNQDESPPRGTSKREEEGWQVEEKRKKKKENGIQRVGEGRVIDEGTIGNPTSKTPNEGHSAQRPNNLSLQNNIDHYSRSSSRTDYQCNECKQNLSSRSSLIAHYNSAHALITCPECLLTFTCQSNLDSHSQLHARLRCCLCRHGFSSQEQLVNHAVSHGYSCSLCPERRGLEAELVEHIRRDHGRGGLVGLCSGCNKGFTSIEMYEEHVKEQQNLAAGSLTYEEDSNISAQFHSTAKFSENNLTKSPDNSELSPAHRLSASVQSLSPTSEVSVGADSQSFSLCCQFCLATFSDSRECTMHVCEKINGFSEGVKSNGGFNIQTSSGQSRKNSEGSAYNGRYTSIEANVNNGFDRFGKQIVVHRRSSSLDCTNQRVGSENGIGRFNCSNSLNNITMLNGAVFKGIGTNGVSKNYDKLSGSNGKAVSGAEMDRVQNVGEFTRRGYVERNLEIYAYSNGNGSNLKYASNGNSSLGNERGNDSLRNELGNGSHGSTLRNGSSGNECGNGSLENESGKSSEGRSSCETISCDEQIGECGSDWDRRMNGISLENGKNGSNESNTRNKDGGDNRGVENYAWNLNNGRKTSVENVMEYDITTTSRKFEMGDNSRRTSVVSSHSAVFEEILRGGLKNGKAPSPTGQVSSQQTKRDKRKQKIPKSAYIADAGRGYLPQRHRGSSENLEAFEMVSSYDDKGIKTEPVIRSILPNRGSVESKEGGSKREEPCGLDLSATRSERGYSKERRRSAVVEGGLNLLWPNRGINPYGLYEAELEAQNHRSLSEARGYNEGFGRSRLVSGRPYYNRSYSGTEGYYNDRPLSSLSGFESGFLSRLDSGSGSPFEATSLLLSGRDRLGAADDRLGSDTGNEVLPSRRDEKLLAIEFTAGAPYTCTACNNLEIGLSFEELETHCLTEHSRNPCRYCPKTFAQKANRDRHMCLHTGDKPYGCPDCSERFSRGDKLKMHRVRTHGAQYPTYTSRQKDKGSRAQVSSTSGLEDLSFSSLDPEGQGLSFRGADALNDSSSQISGRGREEDTTKQNEVLGKASEDGLDVGKYLEGGSVYHDPYLLSKWMLSSSMAGSEMMSRLGWTAGRVLSSNRQLKTASDLDPTWKNSEERDQGKVYDEPLSRPKSSSVALETDGKYEDKCSAVSGNVVGGEGRVRNVKSEELSSM